MTLLADNESLSKIFEDSEMQAKAADEERKDLNFKDEDLNITLSLDAILDKLVEAISNRSLDLNFRCYLLKNAGTLCKHDSQRADNMATNLLNKNNDYN